MPHGLLEFFKLANPKLAFPSESTVKAVAALRTWISILTEPGTSPCGPVWLGVPPPLIASHKLFFARHQPLHAITQSPL